MKTPSLKRFGIRSYVLLTLLCFISTSARGEQLQYSLHFVTQGGTLSIPRFDPAVGTLTELSIWTRLTFSGGWHVFNGSDLPLTISRPFMAGMSTGGFPSFLGGVVYGTVSGTVPPQSTALLPAYASGSPEMATFTDPGELAFYTGQSPLELYATCTAQFTDAHEWVNGDFIYDVDLTYHYAVPEPSTLTLVAIGLLAVLRTASRKH